MEHCVHDHLPDAAHLAIIEYAVNTDRNPASFERLLRKARLHGICRGGVEVECAVDRRAVFHNLTAFRSSRTLVGRR